MTAPTSGRRILVAGGAGFLGSHVCEALLARGDAVIALDNLLTGEPDNLAHLVGRAGFGIVCHDVTERLEVDGRLDAVLHFASPASPADYLAHPLPTLRAGSLGTEHLLQLADSKQARFFLASTSEVYGDPAIHPQPETYWGNVNPIGPRSVYDEAKRYAEAITMAYGRTRGVDVRIARIFNTYGPRLRPGDGRVVSNFVVQALRGDPITIYGDGTQTRSFCFVDDEVRGLLAVLDGPITGPVNVGNPAETTIRELAETVLEVTGSRSELAWLPLPEDDPTRRRPDITLARTELAWEPEVTLTDGVARTATWMADRATR